MTPLARTYTEARQRFSTAATARGAETTTFVHPLAGRDEEQLAIDVAVLGPADAGAAMVLVSGTHGVEGFTGSALQSHWFEDLADARPDDVRVVVVHALNPYGFSWVRRVNEDNVDLNRNFVDWSSSPPVNERYGGVAALLVPEQWDAATQQDTMHRLLDAAVEVGMEEFQQIVSGGQYAHPTGVFYGGSGPTWSNQWLTSHFAALVGGAPRVVIVDLHTGLGPNGHGELISHEGRGADGYLRARRWWDDVRSMVDGESVSASLTGDWLASTEALLEGREVTAVALEYGTVDTVTVLQALRADAWLHVHGDPASAEGGDIRAQVRAAFADESPEWLAEVTARFDEVVAGALTNLSPSQG